MCSIVLFNDAFLATHDTLLLALMRESNIRGGGDGTGIAALLPDGDVITHKGHDVTPAECWSWSQGVQSDTAPIRWYCFHTRRATTAKRNDSTLNQPFYDKSVGLALAHVGTIHELDIWSKLGHAWSDGRMVFELATKYSSDPVRDTYRASLGIVAGFYQGNPYWHGTYGTSVQDGEALCLCSIGLGSRKMDVRVRSLGDCYLPDETSIVSHLERPETVKRDWYHEWYDKQDTRPVTVYRTRK